MYIFYNKTNKKRKLVSFQVITLFFKPQFMQALLECLPVQIAGRLCDSKVGPGKVLNNLR